MAGLAEMHDLVWSSARRVRKFRSRGGQGLEASAVGVGKDECQGRRWGRSLNLYKRCPSPVGRVRGLGF